MMHPSDLNLPYPAWQGQQVDLIARIASSDKRYVVVEAPTGIGKSAVAMGAGFLLGDRTVVLTGTKQLQDQYREQIPGVEIAMGRDNYPCAIESRVTAARGECVTGTPCTLKNSSGCEYYGAIIQAERAARTALNYPYWLNQVNWAHRFGGVETLVCDEAHLLEDELRRFVSVTVSRAHCTTIGFRLDRGTRDWGRWARVVLQEYKTQYEAVSGKYGGSQWGVDWARAIKSVYRAALMIDEHYDPEGWVVLKRPWGFELRPVWVSQYFLPYIDTHVRGRIVMMSATILSVEQFARQLGLDLEQVDFVQCDSPFPVKNRLLYYQPVGRVSFKNPQVVRALVTELDDILDEHEHERGLVHTSSYKLAQELFRGSQWQDRMVLHDTKSRAKALEKYRRTPGAVLVSPSMGTGVDLPYDLVRFQIIAKLPFPDLSDPQTKQRMKVGPDGLPNPRGESWYTWQTACAIVQMYGRGVRAIDDACKTYLLDGNWSWFKAASRSMLPKWFTRAIVNRNQSTNVTVADVLAKIRA